MLIHAQRLGDSPFWAGLFYYIQIQRKAQKGDGMLNIIPMTVYVPKLNQHLTVRRVSASEQGSFNKNKQPENPYVQDMVKASVEGYTFQVYV